MRARITTLAAFAIAAVFASTAGAQAKTVTCSDGTTSTATGRGACSGHGGVKKAEKKVEKKAESAAKKSEKAAEKTAAKTEKKSEGAAKKAASSGAAKSVAKKEGAQVTCTDGTMSKPGRGACSGHGGVKKG